jgi:hypothetical protein
MAFDFGWLCGLFRSGPVDNSDATTFYFFVLFRYIIRAPLGSEGWIIGVNSLEGMAPHR